MINTAKYRVELRLDGVLIGDVRPLAQNLTWKRCRTKSGVDSISFTLNDVLFEQWCVQNGTSIAQIIKPIALDCRIVRDGVPVIGGFLATVPSYQPNQSSANLQMQFDGYQNLLAGVYIYPVGTQTGRMGTLVKNWINLADTRATTAGKPFGFSIGTISTMASVTQTFDNYTTVKDIITNRCDNISGAGPFDVFWHADRTYDIIKDSEFGEIIQDYTIYYPTRLNGVSATSIRASEISEFASTVIGIGSGDISSDQNENTAITSVKTNSNFVRDYGYKERLIQLSSVSNQQTLDADVDKELSSYTNLLWEPQITLSGKQIKPAMEGENKIWIGDTVKIVNAEDKTGMSSGSFRVNTLTVSVGNTGAEIITPELERVS